MPGKFATVEDRRSTNPAKSHSFRSHHSGLQHSQRHLGADAPKPELAVSDLDDDESEEDLDGSLTSLDQSVAMASLGYTGEDSLASLDLSVATAASTRVVGVVHHGGEEEMLDMPESRGTGGQSSLQSIGIPEASATGDRAPALPHKAVGEGSCAAKKGATTRECPPHLQNGEIQPSTLSPTAASTFSTRGKGEREENTPKRRATTSRSQKKVLWNIRDKPFYIILPQNSFRSTWDMYIGILLLYVGAFIPFRLSYLNELKGIMKAVEIFVDISFGIDIILNFFTAYERPDGKLEFRMKKIAKKYIKGYFFLDLIATFPLEVVIRRIQGVSGVNHVSKLSKMPKLFKIIKMTRFLKVLRVYRLTNLIREVEISYNIHQGITRLVNNVVVVLFVTHLVGCLWHAIGVELDVDKATESCANMDGIGTQEEGWLCREGLIDRNLGHKYVASVYWSFSTLTTVGYGDIAARTVGEQGFSMIMMLLGVSWYAYVVGSMSAIISSFDRQNKQMRLKMLQVNTFIREAKLPTPLGHRIRRYYEYLLSKRKNGLFGYDADEILLELSTSLRTDIILHVDRELIRRVPFFEGKSPNFVANTIQVFQPVVVQQGDYIIKEGSSADEMFFLLQGSAAVYYGQKQVATLTEGGYFGEIGCILGGIRRAGIKAETTCELQCLSKRNLNLLLGQHPEVGEDLKLVARSRMKEVKKEKREKRKQSVRSKPPRVSKLEGVPPAAPLATVSEEPKKSIAEENLDKLDRVDFSELDDENEAFSDLKSDLKGMQRKLSLTSGTVAGGSHVKPNDETIKELNSTTDPNPQGKDAAHGEGAPFGECLQQKKSAAKILESLSPSDQQVIRDYIHQEVVCLLEDNMTSLADRLVANNERIVARAREKWLNTLKTKSNTC